MPSSANAYTVTHRDFTTVLTDSYDLAVEADKNVTFSIPCQTGEYKILFVAFEKEAPDNPIRKSVSDVNLTACQVFKTNLALAECSSKQENC